MGVRRDSALTTLTYLVFCTLVFAGLCGVLGLAEPVTYTLLGDVRLQATVPEQQMGRYTVAPGVVVLVVPGTPAAMRLKEHLNHRVSLLLRVEE